MGVAWKYKTKAEALEGKLAAKRKYNNRIRADRKAIGLTVHGTVPKDAPWMPPLDDELDRKAAEWLASVDGVTGTDIHVPYAKQG